MNGNLVPEVRVDKRGIAVTRHVKPQTPRDSRLSHTQPPAPAQEQQRTRAELQYIFERNIRATSFEKYNSVLRWFPLDTLQAIAERVTQGDKIENSLITDAFNVNDFFYPKDTPTLHSIRELNCIALASDLLPRIPFESWGPLRRIYSEASFVIPLDEEHSRLENIDAAKVRAAVLVHATVEDDSPYRNHANYEDALELFKLNHDAILDALPELMKRHENKEEIDFGIVHEIISSHSSLSSGAL